MQIYKVLGVMSGTSLDGLDLAYCELVKTDKWTYKILHSATIPYSEKRENILRFAYQLSGEELVSLDHKFGKYIGEECKKFIHQHHLQPDLISSHGHTVFHQPQRGFTFQIGHGADIYSETGIPVVSDFRSQDVALGGEGAPLVPVGDHYLFSQYEACLNLGGFANISAQQGEKQIAWDICAVNIILNHYARKLGVGFDEGGALAHGGKLHEKLLNELNAIDFYQQLPPKSLGIEWVEQQLIHLLEKYPIPVEDILHTYTLHIASLIGMTIDQNQAKKVLITGGGAYNHFLVKKIKEKTRAMVDIPDHDTIQYKEALIFGLLGVLKWRGEINIWKSVTGAKKDHSSGIIYGK
jgi:anhydro-N-acetylmuramic acid kinase